MMILPDIPVYFQATAVRTGRNPYATVHDKQETECHPALRWYGKSCRKPFKPQVHHCGNSVCGQAAAGLCKPQWGYMNGDKGYLEQGTNLILKPPPWPTSGHGAWGWKWWMKLLQDCLRISSQIPLERRRTSFEIMACAPTKFATTLCDTVVGKVRRTLWRFYAVLDGVNDVNDVERRNNVVAKITSNMRINTLYQYRTSLLQWRVERA